MDRLRAIFTRPTSYSALSQDTASPSSSRGASPSRPGHAPAAAATTVTRAPTSAHFSRGDYGVFVLLGVAMLWAWNMFLAAAPYFSDRLAADAWAQSHFQSAIVSVSTATNLAVMALLTRLPGARPTAGAKTDIVPGGRRGISSSGGGSDDHGSSSNGGGGAPPRRRRRWIGSTAFASGLTYPARISWSCIVNTGTFALLAISTKVGTSSSSSSAGPYLAFLLAMVCLSSAATGLSQNGVFAYVSGMGEPRYAQGVMTGQAVAGILPPLVQVLAVLSTAGGGGGDADGRKGSDGSSSSSSTSAMNYFIVATLISLLALVAFGWHLRRNDYRTPIKAEPISDTLPSTNKPAGPVPLLPLLFRLKELAAAVFLCFAITMPFAVYTASIHSIHETIDTSRTSSRLNSFAVFVPLAFFFWNLGDLLGRLATASPACDLSGRPRLLLALALARLVWIPAYRLCNVGDRGAAVQSDVFYLVLVQLLFGLGNGWLGSSCMMGPSAMDALDDREKEAAGGIMSMSLVAGLTVGSLLSFAVRP